MTQDNKNTLENNIPLNDNDNGSLNENTCLKPIPYEVALQQNGWGGIKAYYCRFVTRRAFLSYTSSICFKSLYL
ncbi:hypothetical protein BHOIPH791_04220 [Bartonella henselae]|nr:hypothetical protein Q653_01488 [Bartonella henselae JK 42]ETS08582.1 hypothetical protein Q655_00851 [Bartonella henselae JK 51]ETS09129.1 hypothetical protein Q654_00898 [Bartonella henselae JK 50]ETS12120.1 hypothetical protein Q652_01463 [Bartonella henselae JK 41]KEC56419.1 hypothetical protein O97_01386 [Bartonella henselae str. Zeus]KEC59121.1 hypothetical protein O95_01364 [Bartonella henselae JK 53]CDO40269.1 hypothetical protein PRJBM_00891 [Bartonella henselae]